MAVTEIALLPVRRGEEAAFESAMRRAAADLTGVAGFRGISVRRPAEPDGCYLLSIEWDRIEDHRDGFRGSPAYDRWRERLHGFYDELPPVNYMGDRVI